MAFLEKHFQTKFGRWFIKNKGDYPYELKIAYVKSLNFNKFQDQQLPALYKAKHGTYHHKLSDASLGLKGFDGFGYTGAYSKVGIMFNIKKGNKSIAYLLEIDDVYKLKETQKSIGLDDAIRLGKEIEV